MAAASAEKPALQRTATAGETPAARKSNPPAADRGKRGKIFFRKSEEPGARSPLTYRELAIAVEAGTPQDVALAVARAHLDDVRGELDRLKAPEGRLVQLAVFDHEWTGRPQRAPLVSLTWKDWRGAEPEVKYANGKGASGKPATPSNRPPAMDVKAVASEISSAVEVTRPAQVAPRPADVPPAIEAIVSAPAAATSAAAKPAAGAPAVASPAGSSGSAAASSPAKATKRKARPEDLMSEMFEAMHDVHFMQNALEGADFVLDLLREKLPTRVALVHFYDINAKEFVVVKARAPQAAVFGARTKEGTGLVGAALKTGKPLRVTDAANDKRWSRERYGQAGHATPREIVVVPMKSGSRYLGALEIADHEDGGSLGDTEVHALAYVADQLAEFVNERGILLSAGDSTGSFQAVEARAAGPKSRR